MFARVSVTLTEDHTSADPDKHYGVGRSATGNTETYA